VRERPVEVLGDEHRDHHEGGVRPEEGVRVERAVRASTPVDALDGAVVVAHLGGRLDGPLAVVDHAADRVQRPVQPLPALVEEPRVLLDAGPELGMHVLHRPGPQREQHAAPITEIAPGQGLRAERLHRFSARGSVLGPVGQQLRTHVVTLDLTTGVVNLAGLGDDRCVSTRSWAGTSLADRRAERRLRLLDVGLELLGTQGSGAVTVRSICRAAQLTDRYFYESFADRDALLVAIYDEVGAQAAKVLVDAVASAPADDHERVARAAVEAFLELLTADPRKGRVLLLEPLTDPVLGARSVLLSPAFAAIIRGRLGDGDELAAQLSATALVGAMANLFIRWLDGSLAVRRDVLTGFCVRLVVAATELAAGELAG
jgi:AcrR family transcriptional regulator